MIDKLVTQFEDNDRRIFWSLITLTGVAIFLYVYFLSISVFAVVNRRLAEREVDRLTINISVLESSYATLEKKISLELAVNMGFKEISVPRYVRREVARDALTLRTDKGIR